MISLSSVASMSGLGNLSDKKTFTPKPAPIPTQSMRQRSKMQPNQHDNATTNRYLHSQSNEKYTFSDVNPLFTGSRKESKRKSSILVTDLKQAHNKNIESNENNSDNVYPETISAYLEGLGDGFRVDLHDLWKTSIRYLFPSTYSTEETKANNSNSTENELQNLEIADNKENKVLANQNTVGIRLRCPSTWVEGSGQSPTSNLQAENPLIEPVNENEEKQKSQKSFSPKLTQGKRISLVKLYNTKDALYYECLGVGMLILGQKKMLYVEKNLDIDCTATVVWWLTFQELSTCLLSFQPDGDRSYVKLQLMVTNGNSHEVHMADALACAKILQIIEGRRAISMSAQTTILNETSTGANQPAPQSVVVELITQKEDRMAQSLYQSNIQTEDSKLKTTNQSELSTDRHHDDLLSPASTNRATILARQLQFGVSELGLLMKLENEGVDENKSKKLIYAARQHLNRNSKPIERKTFADDINHAGNEDIKREISITFESIHPEVSSPTVCSPPKPTYKQTLLSHTPTQKSNQLPSSPMFRSPTYKKSSNSITQTPSKNMTPRTKFENGKPHLKKYLLMLKHGVPWAAVETKLTADGMSEEEKAFVRTTGLSNSLPQQKENVVAQTPIHPAKLNSHPSEGIVGCPAHLKKYLLMIKHGVPLSAVVTKMNTDNLPNSDLKYVTNYSQSISNQPACSLGTSTENPKQKNNELPENLNRYLLMLKRGVPEEAVTMKMRIEGVDSNEQELVLSAYKQNSGSEILNSNQISPTKKHKEVGSWTVATSKQPLQLVLSPSKHLNENKNKPPVHQDIDIEKTHVNKSELPDRLKKYQSMIKHGVPLQAVITRMNIEQLSQDDQQIIIDSVSDSSTSSVHVKTTRPRANSISGTSAPLISGPKLVGLHWEPLDKVYSPTATQNNLWKDLATRRSSMTTLHEEEMKDLVNLFARKETSSNISSKKAFGRASIGGLPTKKVSGIDGKENNVSDTNIGSPSGKTRSLQSKAPMKPKILDFSRCMSISIVLTAFKSNSVDVDKLCTNIKQLNFRDLPVEHLLRVKEILPSDNDVQAFKTLGKQSDTETLLTLVEPERVLCKLCSIGQLKARLQALLFLSTWEPSLASIDSKIDALDKMTDLVKQSEGLGEILQTVLVIGNAMNGGSWKGAAVGFRLSSLSKLSQTKSADGQCTVLDYMVQMLYTRAQTGGDKSSTIALVVDEELSTHISQSKQVCLPDISKDLACLDFDNKQFLNLLNQASDELISLAELKAIQDAITLKIEGVKEKLAIIKERIHEFESYFGEPRDSCPQMLAYLDDFLKTFKIAKGKYVANLKKKERQSLAGQTKKTTK